MLKDFKEISNLYKISEIHAISNHLVYLHIKYNFIFFKDALKVK